MRHLLQRAIDALEYHISQTRPIINSEVALSELKAALKECVVMEVGSVTNLPKQDIRDVVFEPVKEVIYSEDGACNLIAQYELDTLKGLWATDKPAAIPDSAAHLFFRIGYPNQKLNRNKPLDAPFDCATLRDEFAMVALSNKEFTVGPYDTTRETAHDCYKMADAMMKERSK